VRFFNQLSAKSNTGKKFSALIKDDWVCEEVITKLVLSEPVKFLRTALFWVITQHVMVILYRRFGTTYRSHLNIATEPCNFSLWGRMQKAKLCRIITLKVIWKKIFRMYATVFISPVEFRHAIINVLITTNANLREDGKHY
jgi:hypothetical protein